MTWFLLLIIIKILTINWAAPIDQLKSDINHLNNETLNLTIAATHFRENLTNSTESFLNASSLNEILGSSFQKLPEDLKYESDTIIEQQTDEVNFQSSDDDKKEIFQSVLANLKKPSETSATQTEVSEENTTFLNDHIFQSSSYPTMAPQQVLSTNKPEMKQTDTEEFHPLENFSTISKYPVENGMNPVVGKYETEEILQEPITEFVLISPSDVTEESLPLNEEKTSLYIIENSNVTPIPSNTVDNLMNQVAVDTQKATKEIRPSTDNFNNSESSLIMPETAVASKSKENAKQFSTLEEDLNTINDVKERGDKFDEILLTTTEIYSENSIRENNISDDGYNVITAASILEQPLDFLVGELNNADSTTDSNKIQNHFKDMKTRMPDITPASLLDSLDETYDTKSNDLKNSKSSNISTSSPSENSSRSISKLPNESSTEYIRYEEQSTLENSNYDVYSTSVSAAANVDETTALSSEEPSNTEESTTFLNSLEKNFQNKDSDLEEVTALEGDPVTAENDDDTANKTEKTMTTTSTELQPEIATHFETTAFDRSRTTVDEIKLNEYTKTTTTINKKENVGSTTEKQSSSDINEDLSTIFELEEANASTTASYETTRILRHPPMEEVPSLLTSATHMREITALSPQKSKEESKITVPAVEETTRYLYETLENNLNKSQVKEARNDTVEETTTLRSKFDVEISATNFEYGTTTENYSFSRNALNSIRNEIKENILTTTESWREESTTSTDDIFETTQATTLISMPLWKSTDTTTMVEASTQLPVTNKQEVLQTIQASEALEKSTTPIISESSLPEIVTFVEQTETTTNTQMYEGTAQTEEIATLTSLMNNQQQLNESTTVADQDVQSTTGSGQPTTTITNHKEITNQTKRKTEEEKEEEEVVNSTILMEGDATTAAPIELESRPLILPPPKLEYAQSEDGVEVFYGYSIVKRN